jgi:hypothetical protein
MLSDHPPSFRPLSGVHEASGIRQLADGRFIVVEDEPYQPLSLLRLHAGGGVECTVLQPPAVQTTDDDFWQLDDLEAITVDQAGYVYALTSHSRNNAGLEKPAREKLVRFRVEGERVVEPRMVVGLKRALTAAHPLLAAAADIREVKTRGGLNIEGLEMRPDQRGLLLGFRSPLLGRQAVIATIDNPDALFEAGAQAEIGARLLTLDLDGNGIRGIAHFPALGGYLVIGGPIARVQTQFGLWFWTGEPGVAACRVSVGGLAGFEHAEGISPALIDGRQRIIIVSDDGSREDGRFARFLVLDPEQLQIAR